MMMNEMNKKDSKESGTAFEAVPSAATIDLSKNAQTEFGLADLAIEEDSELMDGADFSDTDSDDVDFSFGADSASTDEKEHFLLGQDGDQMADGKHLPDAPVEADGALIADIQSIPEKMAFKIGEAAEMVGVKQYVLRYWESEFDMLRPRKSRNGQRVYSRRDVECAMMIKKLLYNDRFSIEGARHALKQLKSNVKSIVQEEKTSQVMARTQHTAVQHLQSLVEEIRRIRQTL